MRVVIEVPVERVLESVRGGQGAATPEGGERVAVVGIDQPGVRRAQGVLAQVPLGGPRELVFADAGGVGHAARSLAVAAAGAGSRWCR